MVECFLAKEDVAGSTPVSRSNHLPPAIHSSLYSGCALGRSVDSAGRGTQVVRERSAKPLCVGSIPTRASNYPTICTAPGGTKKWAVLDFVSSPHVEARDYMGSRYDF